MHASVKQETKAKQFRMKCDAGITKEGHQYVVPALKWKIDAFGNDMPAQTIRQHLLRVKYHVDMLNDLVADTRFAGMDLEELLQVTYRIRNSSKQVEQIYYHASQHWNHCFFFSSLQPNDLGGGASSNQWTRYPNLTKEIEHNFGNTSAFLTEFKGAAMSVSEVGLEDNAYVWVILNGSDFNISFLITDVSTPVAFRTDDITEADYDYIESTLDAPSKNHSSSLSKEEKAQQRVEHHHQLERKTHHGSYTHLYPLTVLDASPHAYTTEQNLEQYVNTYLSKMVDLTVMQARLLNALKYIQDESKRWERKEKLAQNVTHG